MNVAKLKALPLHLQLESFCAFTGYTENAVRAKIRQDLGAFATPRAIVRVRLVPRTRSGKPLRRLLTAVVTGTDPGDLSTMADPTALDVLREAWADRPRDA